MKKFRLFLPSIKSHLLQLLACATTFFESTVLINDLFEREADMTYIASDQYLELLIYSILAFLAACGLIYEIVNAISDYRRDYGRIFSDDDKEGIDGYLSRFIDTGESVAILSHDMSWINDSNFLMLQKKAQRKELLLLLPEATEKVNKLEEMGADVRYFGPIINDPANALIKSRMTVVNWNKTFPKLTYPIKKDGWHINYEVAAGEPANQLALDLIQLLILTHQVTKKEAPSGMQLVCMLEELTKNDSTKGEYLFQNLAVEEQGKVISWYSQYCRNKEIVIAEVVELMACFFERENLDLYDSVEFGKVRREICDKYNIPSDKFLNMYIAFREMTSW